VHSTPSLDVEELDVVWLDGIDPTLEHTHKKKKDMWIRNTFFDRRYRKVRHPTSKEFPKMLVLLELEHAAGQRILVKFLGLFLIDKHLLHQQHAAALFILQRERRKR